MRKTRQQDPALARREAGEYKPIPTEERASEESRREDAKQKAEDAKAAAWAARPCGAGLIEALWFQNLMGLVILGNGIVIGLETDMPEWHHWTQIENSFLGVFIFELLVKIWVDGCAFCHPDHDDFNWNMFDSIVVGVGVFDVIATFIGTGGSGGFSTVFRLVRLLRILRIFRLLKFLKRLFLLVMGLVEACKAIFWVTILMAVILYMCSIVLVKTIGRLPSADPHYEFLDYHFGSIPQSMLTLFSLMSSPNISAYREETGLLSSMPLLCVFLIIFITVGFFGMIAMLTGVIIDGMTTNNELKKEEERMDHQEHRTNLGAKCAELFESIPSLSANGEASIGAVKGIAAQTIPLLEAAGSRVDEEDVMKMITFMDVDGNGSIDVDEFVKGIEKASSVLSPVNLMEVQHAVGACSRKVTLLETTMSEAVQISEKAMNTIGITLAKESGDSRVAIVEAVTKSMDCTSTRNRQAIEQQVGDVGVTMQQTQLSLVEEIKVIGKSVQKLQDSVDNTDTKVRLAVAQGLADMERTEMSRGGGVLNTAFAQQMQDMQASTQRQITGAISQLSSDMEISMQKLSDQMDRGSETRAQPAFSQKVDEVRSSMQSPLDRKEDRASTVNPALAHQLEEIQVSVQRLAEQKDVREFQSMKEGSPLVESYGEAKAAGAVQMVATLSQQVMEMGKSVQNLADQMDRSETRVQIAVSQQVGEIKTSVQRLLEQKQEGSGCGDSLNSIVAQQIGEMKSSIHRLCDLGDSGREKRLYLAIEEIQNSAQKLVDLKEGEREARIQLAFAQQIEEIGASVQALLRHREENNQDGLSYIVSHQLTEIRKSVQNPQQLEEVQKSVQVLVEKGDSSEVQLQALQRRLDATQKSLLGGMAELGGVVLGGVADLFAKNLTSTQRSPSLQRQEFASQGYPQAVARISGPM